MRSRFSNIIIIADSKLQQWKNILLVFFFARPLMLYVCVRCSRCFCAVCVCMSMKTYIFLRNNLQNFGYFIATQCFSVSLRLMCMCAVCECACACARRKHFSVHERHKKWIESALLLSHFLFVSVDIFNKTISNIFVRCGLSRQFTYIYIIYKHINHKCEARKEQTNGHTHTHKLAS